MSSQDNPPSSSTSSLGKSVLGGTKISLTLLKELMDGVPVPFVKGAAGAALEVIKLAEAVQHNKDDCRSLAKLVADLTEAILRGMSGKKEEDIEPGLREGIERFRSELVSIANDLRRLGRVVLFRRILNSSDDAERIQEHRRNIQAAFDIFQLESSVRQQITQAERHHEVLEGISAVKGRLDSDNNVAVQIHTQLMASDQRELLDRLPRARAEYDSARKCLDGTRTELLGIIKDWALNSAPDQPRIFWLRGLAGKGKSTIASSVADYLDNIVPRRLGASFFFSRDDAARSNSQLVFSTIAHQLAFFHPSLAEHICRSLNEKPDIGNSAVLNQFQKLISQLLRSAQGLEGTVVVVLDALDECKRESATADFLSILSKEVTKLPPLFKFFITSRPEPEIEAIFDESKSSLREFSLDSTKAEDIDRDIDRYLQDRMQRVAHKYSKILGTGDWPGEVAREALVLKAAGLFIWASTAANFIEDENYRDPVNQLEVLLGTGPSSSVASPLVDLDHLYNQILLQACPLDISEPLLQLFQRVIGSIVMIRKPLSASALGALLGLDQGGSQGGSQSGAASVFRTVWKLQAILLIPHDPDTALRIIHPSLVDYLTTEGRCGDKRFFMDRVSHHQRLAGQCLARLQACLKRDMCQIEGFFQFNHEISDIDARLKCVPADVQYACQFWAMHLAEVPANDEALYEHLQIFCFKHLLHWFEVLSLLGILSTAFPSLRMAL